MNLTENSFLIIVILIVFLLFTTGMSSYKLGCNHTIQEFKGFNRNYRGPNKFNKIPKEFKSTI
jgi:hypothetical protein